MGANFKMRVKNGDGFGSCRLTPSDGMAIDLPYWCVAGAIYLPSASGLGHVMTSKICGTSGGGFGFRRTLAGCGVGSGLRARDTSHASPKSCGSSTGPTKRFDTPGRTPHRGHCCSVTEPPRLKFSHGSTVVVVRPPRWWEEFHGLKALRKNDQRRSEG